MIVNLSYVVVQAMLPAPSTYDLNQHKSRAFHVRSEKFLGRAMAGAIATYAVLIQSYVAFSLDNATPGLIYSFAGTNADDIGDISMDKHYIDNVKSKLRYYHNVDFDLLPPSRQHAMWDLFETCYYNGECSTATARMVASIAEC